MNVAVIGASSDKAKFGNKAVRAYAMMGHTVFPVNDHETEIEGIECYKSLNKIPYKIDRISVYVPPEQGLKLVNQIRKARAKEVYLNPGSESDELVEALQKAGVKPILACSVLAISVDPNNL
jgi:predicted CoA-binding protein